MHSRTLGRHGPSVSVVGFGGMPLSVTGRPPENDAIRVIHAALNAGVTLIDTADVYCLNDQDIGHNERLIAKAVRTWSGSPPVVATKGGLIRPGGRWDRRGGPDHLRQACERSLQALGVEQIDLYQWHAPDPRVPFEDSVGALAALQEAGKVARVGLSNVSVDEIERAQTIVEIHSVQNRLNPFFREAVDNGVVQYCDDHGICFLAYSPVGGGRLNKKLPEHPTLSSMSARLGASPHQLVLAWVLAQGSSVVVIPGARSIANAVSSARAADITLSPDDIDAIADAAFSVA